MGELSLSDSLDEESRPTIIEVAGKLAGHKGDISEAWKAHFEKWCSENQVTPLQTVESINLEHYFDDLAAGNFKDLFASIRDACMEVALLGYPYEAALASVQINKRQVVSKMSGILNGADLAIAVMAIDRLYQYSLEILSRSYFRTLEDELAKQGAELSTSQKKLELLHGETQLLTVTDSLTDLYSHQHFVDILKQEYNRALRYDNDFSFLIIDIDNLSQLNERHGQNVGDLVLATVADILKTTFRTTDILGRYGSEEFSAILFESDINQASLAAERLRTMVQIQTSKMVGLSEEQDVTVSIGIANFFESDSVDNLIHLAEEALSRAKEDGRNRIRY